MPLPLWLVDTERRFEFYEFVDILKIIKIMKIIKIREFYKKIYIIYDDDDKF